MKLNYINVVTNNSILVIEKLSNIFIKNKYSIEDFSTSFDDKGNGNIIIGISFNDGKDIEQIISQIYKIPDVIKVIDMSEQEEQIKYLFNVNGNCKKTLKKISKTPDKILETKKEWIYIYLVEKEERDIFVAELNNMKLSFVQRVIGMV